MVLELLHGADLESTSRKYGITAATLGHRRESFGAGCAEALNILLEELTDEFFVGSAESPVAS